ncbi:hypothetical protein GF360_01140 [candidate division WWE3 bacterium]|nr:hypothetical protein [candidate division WWE3 bacterium]
MTAMTSKEKMEKGWKAREAHEFEEAEKLLREALEEFQEKEDWFNATECLNHLAYLKKIQSKLAAEEGFSLAKQGLELAEKHGSKKVHVYRSLRSLSDEQGRFEKALEYAEKCLEGYENPMSRADMQSHIALYKMRTGRLEDAKELAEQALTTLETHWEEEREPHRSIWKTSALLVLGLIAYNGGFLDQAHDYGEEALELAEKADSKTRILQAKQFLDLFS